MKTDLSPAIDLLRRIRRKLVAEWPNRKIKTDLLIAPIDGEVFLGVVVYRYWETGDAPRVRITHAASFSLGMCRKGGEYTISTKYVIKELKERRELWTKRLVDPVPWPLWMITHLADDEIGSGRPKRSKKE